MLSSAIAVSKIAKDAGEAASVLGVKAVLGVLATILEGIQVRLVKLISYCEGSCVSGSQFGEIMMTSKSWWNNSSG
jgi:hypothetical protein